MYECEAANQLDDPPEVLSGDDLLVLVLRGGAVELPCQRNDAELWFALDPDELGKAKELCRECPLIVECREGALRRREPWGVWGGEIFDGGRIVAGKRRRGRPRKESHAPVVTLSGVVR